MQEKETVRERESPLLRASAEGIFRMCLVLSPYLPWLFKSIEIMTPKNPISSYHFQINVIVYWRLSIKTIRSRVDYVLFVPFMDGRWMMSSRIGYLIMCSDWHMLSTSYQTTFGTWLLQKHGVYIRIEIICHRYFADEETESWRA